MKMRILLPLCALLCFSSTSSMSEASSLGALASSRVPAAKINLINSKIDVHAQKALAELFEQGGHAAADAGLLFAAVTAGKLGGIYIQDQGVPALRAKAWGTSWWELIPKGLDAVVLPAPKSEPKGKPIIVLRKSIINDQSRRQAALRDAWAAFLLSESGYVSACSTGNTIAQFAGTKHCLSDAPKPASMPAPKSLVQQGVGLWPVFHTDFNNKKCDRLFMSYDDCVKYIGLPVKPGVKRNELPAPRPASEWSSRQTKHHTKLTLAQLEKIFASELKGTGEQSAERKLQMDHLKDFVDPVNEAFEVLQLDTVESKAQFLAHYAGELGGYPSYFDLTEVPNAKDHRCATPDTFIGRGPLQPTCEKVYVLVLAYLEYEIFARAREVDVGYKLLDAKVQKAIQTGNFDSGSLMNELEALQAKSAEIKRLFEFATAIAANPRLASRFDHGVMFSAMYWHAAACGKNMDTLARKAGATSTADFTGSGAGSSCVSGGAVTGSSSSRATAKSNVYNCAVATLTGKAC